MKDAVYLAAGDNLTNTFIDFYNVTRVMRDGETLAVLAMPYTLCDGECEESPDGVLTCVRADGETHWYYEEKVCPTAIQSGVFGSLRTNSYRYPVDGLKKSASIELKFGPAPEVAHFMMRWLRNQEGLRLNCGLHASCVHEVGGYTPAYNYLCDEDASVNETVPFELIRLAMEQGIMPSPTPAQTMPMSPERTHSERTMYETPGKTLVPYPSPVPTSTPVQIPDTERSEQGSIMKSLALRQSFSATPKENLLLQENVENKTLFKLKPWQWATIGLGATAVVIGGTVVGLLIKRHIRNKNEIQIELIDDPALGHTLLQN
jgi:hypothetical protein